MSTNDTGRLQSLLETMNVPVARKAVATQADIHWLGRNLAIQNSAHPEIEAAREELERLGARLVL
ncbi:hypothetical protein [Croceicoccus gelatinilyticus]|uniref:hypothetical protein n=1 Tax=Croceicoccus gelatinilyticus TaxID=2835536 RepID=UPI001BD11C2B|nr:hypothetical protein [Croceicoccus gelatinilyticus]MBS7671374.1 hypothetical protein [Croceicoccus gelatinilyticus]